MVGGVKGHEQKVMQFLQQYLQKNKIALSVSLQPGQRRLAVTVLLHRVKPRLPTDELQSSQQVMLALCCIVDLHQLITPSMVLQTVLCAGHSKQSVESIYHVYNR